ncbi:unnamed protein product [Brassica rapa subsp. trilocularis]
MLFHYDGRASEWEEFEWSKRAIHVSIRKQTKWWYAKRFLHPEIVAPYEYIFIWDEDLGVEHFVIRKSMHAEERNGWCSDPNLPPCAAYTTLLTCQCSSFSSCIASEYLNLSCLFNAHEKIGVIDAQWIVHQGVPSLGNQGRPEEGKQPWEGFIQRSADQSYSYQLTSIQLRYRVFVTIHN